MVTVPLSRLAQARSAPSAEMSIRLFERPASAVAVSPIVGGRAVKGPLASMIPRLSGAPASAEAVARHYEGVLDGYVVHEGDRFEAPFPVLETNILIQRREDRVVLARTLLEFARSLG